MFSSPPISSFLRQPPPTISKRWFRGGLMRAGHLPPKSPPMGTTYPPVDRGPRFLSYSVVRPAGVLLSYLVSLSLFFGCSNSRITLSPHSSGASPLVPASSWFSLFFFLFRNRPSFFPSFDVLPPHQFGLCAVPRPPKTSLVWRPPSFP